MPRAGRHPCGTPARCPRRPRPNRAISHSRQGCAGVPNKNHRQTARESPLPWHPQGLWAKRIDSVAKNGVEKVFWSSYRAPPHAIDHLNEDPAPPQGANDRSAADLTGAFYFFEAVFGHRRLLFFLRRQPRAFSKLPSPINEGHAIAATAHRTRPPQQSAVCVTTKRPLVIPRTLATALSPSPSAKREEQAGRGRARRTPQRVVRKKRDAPAQHVPLINQSACPNAKPSKS